MEEPNDPTEQELPEAIEDKPVDYDIDSDPLNTMEEPRPPIALKGSEEISLEYGGVRLSLGSSITDVGVLSSLAMTIYYELKGIKPKENNGTDYIG